MLKIPVSCIAAVSLSMASIFSAPMVQAKPDTVIEQIAAQKEAYRNHARSMRDQKKELHKQHIEAKKAHKKARKELKREKMKSHVESKQEKRMERMEKRQANMKKRHEARKEKRKAARAQLQAQ